MKTQIKQKKLAGAACLAAFWCCASANVPAQSLNNPAVFIQLKDTDAGYATLTPSLGGGYVYNSKPIPERQRTVAFAVGKAGRLDFEFFSPQEEQALWRLRQKKMQEAASANALLRKPRQPKSYPSSALVWPRVVLNGAQICVPKLEKSEVVNWRDYLTCWQKKGN